MIKNVVLISALAVMAGCCLSVVEARPRLFLAETVVPEVTEVETVLAKGKVVVVDFGAPWCAPCRRLEPEFKKWAERHPEANFVKVNIDKAPKLKKDYKIDFVPQIIVMKGDKMIRLTENTEAKVVEAIKALE